MRAELLAFATTGDPGWPRYRVGQRSTRVYAPAPHVVPYPEEQSRALWTGQHFEPWSVRAPAPGQ